MKNEHLEAMKSEYVRTGTLVAAQKMTKETAWTKSQQKLMECAQRMATPAPAAAAAMPAGVVQGTAFSIRPHGPRWLLTETSSGRNIYLPQFTDGHPGERAWSIYQDATGHDVVTEGIQSTAAYASTYFAASAAGTDTATEL